MRMYLIILILLLATPFSGGTAIAKTLSPAEINHLSEALSSNTADAVKQLDDHDKQVLQAVLSLHSNKPKQAIEQIERAAASGDPLLAVIEAEAYRQLAIQAVAQAGSYGQNLQQQRERLEAVDLSAGLAEANARLGALAEKLDGRRGLPRDVLQLGESARNIFIVDKSRSRLSIYRRDEQGGLIRDADEYVVTGSVGGDKQNQGDRRTPNGIYHFIDQLNDPALHARYGPVAFPIDYPNALDELHHKTGSGIWMHGYQQDVSRRPPQDTLGCFALPNERLLQLAPKVTLHRSWVLIGEDIAYGDDDARLALRDSVKQAVESWAAAWSSQNHAAYIAHYDERFHSDTYDYKGWDSYKKRVNSSKSYIRVSLSDLTLIHDPHRWPEGEVAVAEFTQQYESSNLNSTSRKRLYLVRADSAHPWKILIEETVPSV